MWGWVVRLDEMFLPVACNLVPQFQEISQQLAPDKLKVANEEFKTMEDLGIIQLSDSQYSLPLHIVQNLSGGWWPCGDYKHLNVTSDDSYPLPPNQ